MHNSGVISEKALRKPQTRRIQLKTRNLGNLTQFRLTPDYSHRYIDCSIPKGIPFPHEQPCTFTVAVRSPRSSRLNEKPMRKGHLRNPGALAKHTLPETADGHAFGSCNHHFAADSDSIGAF
jgi:hypothetical protein